MAKIFHDFHFQIFVQMFVFNSWPKNRRENFWCKKNAGVALGAISFDKAFK
jgi:hypothetical protein